jgi:hypothetical protein
VGCIDRQSEDNLVGSLVVVGIEEFGVVTFEGVTGRNDFLASFYTVVPTGCARVDLGVEIELGQQTVSCCLGSTTIFARSTILQIGVDI